jgi:hypothetical protein
VTTQGGLGILDDMNGALAVARQFLRGALPYPDVLRRGRARRKAFRLIISKQWPGPDATGMDGAQLALLRLLHLQQLTRSAVSERRSEDAALLARVSIETCIVGLYCLHSGDAIADLSAANRQSGQAGSYLSDASLDAPAALAGAVAALGELGPDLNVRDLALWLEREQELLLAGTLYHAYYLPLSHLFARPYAFALMRHVDPGGRLRRRPLFQWARCSAARVADACTGLLAANIADVAGDSPELFLRYATAHFDRALTPAFAFAVKGALREGRKRAFPAKVTALAKARTYAGDSGSVLAGPEAGGPSYDGAVSAGQALDGVAYDGAAYDGAAYDGAGYDGAAYDGASLDGSPAVDGGRTAGGVDASPAGSIPAGYSLQDFGVLTVPAGEDTPALAWNGDPEAERQPRHRRPTPN